MIRVLVIDDSAVMRTFLAGVVEAQPDMELAGVVSDPLHAIDRIRKSAPDVITLDVEMPRMNGLDFLRTLMAVRPLPVIMISSHTREGADATVRALELGAVDFFPKPDSLQQLDAVAADIAEKIRAAAQARVSRRRPAAAVEHAQGAGRVAVLPPGLARPTAREAVIGIGASTGGVEALRVVLAELPDNMPPILIAQHMLPGFTAPFARRLDSICKLRVKEAEDEEEAFQGTAYIAPGGRHLVLDRRAGRYLIRITDDAPVNRHRPSVDTLLRSLAVVAGPQSIAMMLTGMGADGAEAMAALRAAGGRTLAQDEASCVVFGMPGKAIALGGVQEVLPLDDMAGRLIELCGLKSLLNR
ncbi:MAG: chemotaxis response regulator protein-glutamate methylesterase [Comamonadaceae bacterium]|nr:MAG: chemotaxis response regulator protein-glutamate methylesterase [Comamonadaceae bacterium]